MIAPLLVAAFALAQPAEPVELSRVFVAGQTERYRVHARLQVEERNILLRTFIPEDLDLEYDFSFKVQEMKADGIADVLYERPTMVETIGETFESPPIRNEEKIDFKFLLTVSPINEVIDQKDLSPATAWAERAKATLMTAGIQPDESVAAIGALQPFISEMTRLALSIGSLDSSLDFAPRLPYDAVVPGDTWQRTVSYQPQKREGQEASAVQRLDYTYTYEGLLESKGKMVHRIKAEFTLDSDGADFIFDNYDIPRQNAQLTKVPLKLQSTILFDLDPKTFRTINADAQANGSVVIYVRDFGDDPLIERRISGRTTMKPLSP